VVDDKDGEDEAEESSSEESDFTLRSKHGSKTSTPNTTGNKRILDEGLLEERKKRKLVKEEATKRLIELQDQKTDKMIEMLANYDKDHSVLIDRMNSMAEKLNKINGYTSEDNEQRTIVLPSSKNEEVFKQMVQINEEQESIENLPSTQTTPPKQTSPEQESIATLPSTQTKPPKENSTLVVATLNRAETPKKTSNQTESPNSLNNTSTRTNANKKISIEEEDTGVQLSEEDLRISLLSNEELNKEVVAFLMQGSSDEATKLLNRHKELKRKGINVCVKM
jgi:hypothetical protein